MFRSGSRGRAMRTILGRLATRVRLMPEDDLIAEILREYGSAEAPGGPWSAGRARSVPSWGAGRRFQCAAGRLAALGPSLAALRLRLTPVEFSA